MFVLARAVFSLKSTIHKWTPPFSRDVTHAELNVEEGQGFDDLEKIEGKVFKLVKCDGNKALVEFNHKFTLKGHEHPRNRQIWVGRLETINFTYLWGEDGITKSLRLKEIIE